MPSPSVIGHDFYGSLLQYICRSTCYIFIGRAGSLEEFGVSPARPFPLEFRC